MATMNLGHGVLLPLVPMQPNWILFYSLEEIKSMCGFLFPCVCCTYCVWCVFHVCCVIDFYWLDISKAPAMKNRAWAAKEETKQCSISFWSWLEDSLDWHVACFGSKFSSLFVVVGVICHDQCIKDLVLAWTLKLQLWLLCKTQIWLVSMKKNYA